MPFQGRFWNYDDTKKGLQYEEQALVAASDGVCIKPSRLPRDGAAASTGQNMDGG